MEEQQAISVEIGAQVTGCATKSVLRNDDKNNVINMFFIAL
jgi:hypothetical protein